MELVKVPRKRGRKRKIKVKDDEDCEEKLETNRGIALVGRYVKKQFKGRNYIGKIVSYDSGLYRVEYEDGDCEDLDSGEARPFLVGDQAFTKTLLNKKRKLDDMLFRKAQASEKKTGSAALSENTQTRVDTDVKDLREEGDSEVVSASESCKDSAFEPEAELVTIIPLELPPSSGTIGVPEEYVSHLFSVYSFLRSFSIRLFLSPFGLDEFVGALNCPVQNTLMDAIHVALLRALRRHLESTSADVSELSSKCLRCIDWGLLDSLTWPVYIVRYLMVTGYAKGNDWKGFYAHVNEREYYSLPASVKLVILQMLCDDVLNSAELREEVEMRKEEEGEDFEINTIDHSESIPRRVHPKLSKTSACKNLTAIEMIADNQVTKSDSRIADQDSNSDDCRICGMDGTLLCCDGCPSAYHSRCIGVNKLLIPDGAWYCRECTVEKSGHIVSSLASLRSADMFGIDSNKRVFLGTCDHLLVLKAFPDEEPFLRYYNKNDIKRVAQILYSSKLYDTVYSGICEGILKYWSISEDTVHSEKVEMEEIVPNNEGNITGAAQRSSTVNLTVHDVVSNKLSNKSSDSLQHPNGLSFLVKLPFQDRSSYHGGGGIRINESKACIYSGSGFKQNAYINHYVHGDFAAAAAANLSVLSSEKNMALEVQASGNAKKAMSANVLLQVKAFGSVVSCFFWPNSEKKFAEVPREKCGWCLSCQGAVASKKACLLNAACLSSHRGIMKFLSSFRACRIEDACLASIATYILYMEDSFSSLTAGPFLSANYRRQWRQKLGRASTCYDLKSFLLELERNIRDVALSSDWLKFVGDLSFDIWASPNSSLTPAPAPKRGRRRKKLLSSFEAAECEDKDDINWWRGGKTSKFIFQKGILPSQILKKAARQGGRNKILGVDYTVDSAIPRRSRQLIWRAAVEMCKNTSQLALQVRILDHHLRWSDLNRPDQSYQEGKGSDTEASFFRNGLISDKRTVGDKISYGVVFGNQKHLPLRIMKTVSDLEQGQDGRDKHWFPEMRIPLYLIKEFESSKVEACPQSVNRSTKTLSILQKKQLKDARRDIFLYLAFKRDSSSKCSCVACPLEVLLRDAVKCSGCQGYCHADCTLSSNAPANIREELVTPIICNQCYFMKPVTQGESSNSPISPLLALHGRGQNRSAVKGIKSAQPRSLHQSLSTVAMDKSRYTTKLSASDITLSKKKKMSWGLIWKKKQNEDSHVFLQTNLLLRGMVCSESQKPVCTLCQKPHNPELTYIKCETCKKWYHGDAVELDESKISELMGFKCCKCRRIRSPVCPHFNSDTKPEVNGLQLNSNLETVGFRSSGDFESLMDEGSSYLNTDDIFMESDDPLLFSLARVEQVTEPFSESDVLWDITDSGPKKLPVRRQVRNEKSSDYLEHAEQPVCYDAQLADDVYHEAAQNEFVFDHDNIDYQDMEFEQHTYFPMTDLLEDGETDSYNAPVNDQGLCPTSSVSNVAIVGNHESGCISGQQNLELQENQRASHLKCNTCQSALPAPDLICDLCGLSIHRGCSPWFETISAIESWKCGSCREWQ